MKTTHITRDLANENHGHHDTEKDIDNNRVDQAKPMDPWIKDMEVIIPSRRLINRQSQPLDLYPVERTHGVSDSCSHVSCEVDITSKPLTSQDTRYV